MRLETKTPINQLTLTSSAFQDGGAIPARYTCDEDRGTQPPLSISGAPEGTKSFVLIMDDPDIPTMFKASRNIDAFDHWVLYNIPADTAELPPDAGEKGLNGAGKAGYVGPCPPPQYEPREHRYIFSLYALNGMLSFTEPPTAGQVRAAFAPFLLAETKLVGRYSRA